MLAAGRRSGPRRLDFLSPVACRLSPVACYLVATVIACNTAEAPRAASAPRPCPAGDVAVQVDHEAAALARCTAIAGDLAVGPSFALRSLSGLAGIERVAGGVDVSDNLELTGVYLPGLRAVDGDLVVENNRQVATVSLHRLVEVRGDLIVRDNRELLRLDLGQLRRVGGRLVVAGHPLLDAVVLDRLERAGELVADDNPAWPAGEAEQVQRRLGAR